MVANEGDLLHDVLSYTGDVGEEEEGEDTSNGAEASGGTSAAERVLVIDASRKIMRHRGGCIVCPCFIRQSWIGGRLTYKILAR